MSTLRDLKIINQANGKTIPVKEMEGTVTVGEFLAAYAQQIGLPPNAQGRLTRKVTGKELQNNQTLSGAGIEDGETLIADMDYVPGR